MAPVRLGRDPARASRDPRRGPRERRRCVGGAGLSHPISPCRPRRPPRLARPRASPTAPPRARVTPRSSPPRTASKPLDAEGAGQRAAGHPGTEGRPVVAHRSAGRLRDHAERTAGARTGTARLRPRPTGRQARRAGLGRPRRDAADGRGDLADAYADVVHGLDASIDIRSSPPATAGSPATT
jgi:hypothetical protein